ncbi:MAG: serine hydroxymethyltransferase [Phycisphaerae bacterium]
MLKSLSIMSKSDPQMAGIIETERRRQSQTLELIASENHASAAVLEAMGTVLTDKYAEGYPNRRWYCGCENMDAIEQLAVERARKLFGAEHANVQPHSGTSANLAVYLACLKPGMKIMGMRLDQGGHLSHGLEINLSGTCYKAVHYGVRRDTEMLDLDEVRWLAMAQRPDLLVVGASAYPRKIDFAGFASIAREVGCLLMADIAHIAGLVVGGVHPDPVPCADFVTTTTHKTLRGPRGGVILCKGRWARAVDSAIFPGIQGGPLMHVVAAKAVSFLEATGDDFRKYAAAIVANAKALADELLARGWRLVSGGTDNHLMLVDLRSRDENLTGKVAAGWLAQAGIIANKNAIPFDPRPPLDASGVRLGTPALTTRGMGPGQMKQIAGWIDKILTSRGEQSVIESIRGGVAELCGQFPIPDQCRG